MTKEELRATARKLGIHSYVPLMALEEFLSSNVVIAKGENRHPRADVYHQYLEGLIEAELSMYNDDKAPYYCNEHEEIK